MATLVEEFIHIGANQFRELKSISSIKEHFRVKTGEMLAQDKLGRVLNNLNTNLHALNSEKYSTYKRQFTDIVDRAQRHGKLDEDGMFQLDNTAKASLISLMNEIAYEACDMLLDNSGQLRKDIVGFLGWEKFEKKLNDSKAPLMSYIQVITEAITTEWMSETIFTFENQRRKVAKQNLLTLEDFNNLEAKQRNSIDHKIFGLEKFKSLTAVFSGAQLFCTQYFQKKDFLDNSVKEHAHYLDYDIAARCAGSLKELSMKMDASSYQKTLKTYILNDLKDSLVPPTKIKLEYWINVIHFSSGNGDYNTLAAVLTLFDKQQYSISDLSSDTIRKHVSCVATLNYYKHNLIPITVPSMDDKKEDTGVDFSTVDYWSYARNNNYIIDKIFQNYHYQQNLPKSSKPLALKEKTILKQLGDLKFEEGILTPTDEFLSDIENQIGKEGRLAAIVAEMRKNLEQKNASESSLLRNTRQI